MIKLIHSSRLINPYPRFPSDCCFGTMSLYYSRLYDPLLRSALYDPVYDPVYRRSLYSPYYGHYGSPYYRSVYDPLYTASRLPLPYGYGAEETTTTVGPLGETITTRRRSL
eukprot:TRINITY_DN467_c0_g1_i4.p2 TRINITY_DN467_c0_g1~~TRINITY_DN467_c0_g1_i4.p2  ORF type:complete len:111 (-),score=12.85 TRINITY_DN467_c0_g1_i4:43-375(-)